MTVTAEKALIQHLVLPESLSEIARADFPPEVFSIEALRNVYVFACNYWHAEATEGIAPSPDVMRSHFGNVLAEHEIDLDVEPEAILDYVIEAIRGSYIDREWQKWTRNFASYMSEADVLDKPDMLTRAIGELMTIQTKVAARNEHVDLRTGLSRRIDAFNLRAELRLTDQIEGAITGLPQIDSHMSGIRPGELMILGAGPKTGKTWFIVYAAFSNWVAGKSVVVFTLEISVDMFMDRVACLAAGVDSGKWDRGECTPEEVDFVKAWRDEIAASPHGFHVIQPEPGKRTMQHMVRRARTLGEVLLIDQLTFVEPESEVEREPRWRQIGYSLHTLKALIGSGTPMPCILAHQIKREGIQLLRRLGYAEMEMFAESSEVERTADWAYAMWANGAMASIGQCYIQLLASRRMSTADWLLAPWTPWTYIETPEGRIPGVAISGQPLDLRAIADAAAR